MSEQRSVTLTLAERNALLQASGFCAQTDLAPVLRGMAAAWDAAEPLACPACDGTGLVPSLEGCGTRVQCRACQGTGRAS